MVFILKNLFHSGKFFWLTLNRILFFIGPTVKVRWIAFFMNIATSVIELTRILLPRMCWVFSFFEQCSHSPYLFHLWKVVSKVIFMSTPTYVILSWVVVELGLWQLYKVSTQFKSKLIYFYSKQKKST